MPPPAIARHYVVMDTVGNCAVVDAKPADGLKIIGDKNGYASSEAANKTLSDAKAESQSMLRQSLSSRQLKQKPTRSATSKV